MEQVIPVTKGHSTYAIFFRGNIHTDGVRFLTQQTDEFQLGVMERKAGYEVKPHMHPEVNRALVGTSEFLYVESGRMKVTVFDEEWAVLAEEELTSGEFLLFFRGGHAVTMLEDTRLLEVKQGPYPGDTAAKIFRTAA